MSRSGVLAGGNWIVDRVKMIDAWPSQDALANISGETISNGGGPYNVLKDLAKLGASFPLEAAGRVGDDPDGNWILEDCARHGIATHQLHRDPQLPTAYTDVMTVAGTGRRTFFHQRGANAALGLNDFDFKNARAAIFYLGYLLLLDRLDRMGKGGRPLAASVLARARKAGMRTVIDTVSEEGSRFASVILPCLPEVDACIMNEFEAERTTGVRLGTLRQRTRAQLQKAACALFEAGVRERVVLHFEEGAYACCADGTEAWQGSVNVAKVVGASGAGDAFAAGYLYGWHEGVSLVDSLRYGVCAAAASLAHPSTSEGVRPLSGCLRLGHRLGFRDSP